MTLSLQNAAAAINAAVDKGWIFQSCIAACGLLLTACSPVDIMQSPATAAPTDSTISPAASVGTEAPSTTGTPSGSPTAPIPPGTDTGNSSSSSADGASTNGTAAPGPQPVQHRAIWIGDSLAAGGWGYGGNVVWTAGGFVVAGSVATLTTTSPHALIPGNYVQIFNPGDWNYSAPLNGAVVKVLTVPSPTRFTVSATFGGQTMPAGDYSSGYSAQIWQVRSMFQVTDQSWLQWLNQFLGGYFTVVANYAQGGTASSVGVRLLPKIQAGPKAEYAVIQYCTNDENSSTPDVAGCLSNIRMIVAGVEALGMVPILCTPPALGDSQAQPRDPATTIKAAALRAVVQGEQQIAQADPRIIMIDTYSRTVTPGDPAGHYLPKYAPVDGIHPSTYGGMKLGQSVAAELRTLLPVEDLLPSSPLDESTLFPSGSDIIHNGLMAGTGGAIGSSAYNTVTGTVPTGWTFLASGGTAVLPVALRVAGGATHPTMQGFSLDIDVDSASAGQGFQAGTNGPNGSNFGQRMAAGSWYRCGFQLLANKDLAALNLRGQVLLQFSDGTSTSVGFMGTGGAQYDNGTPLTSGTSLEYLSQPFLIPQAVAAGYLFISGNFSGPANGDTFSLGRAFCRTVANPYQ